MIEPLLSVVCITYNHEKFIAQAIDGFLMQKTDFPIEIIIHDDCSTDNTKKIIKNYANKYPELIKTIYQTENQYSQGNKPLKFILPLCRGKYIAQCEGDDFWVDSRKLQIQVDFLEANPDYVISSHDAFIIDESGNRLKDSKLPDEHKRDASCEDLILSKAWLLTMSWVFRNVIKGYTPERAMVINGDTFFISQLGKFGKSKYHSEIQPAAYRSHSGGVWSMVSDQEKYDSHINTWFWMYRYYTRQKQNKYAQYYWNKYILSIYNKLSTERNSDLDTFPNTHSMFDGSSLQSEIESLLTIQLQRIKQLEIRSKSSEKLLSDIKNSFSYRIGNTLLWPIRILIKHRNTN